MEGTSRFWALQKHIARTSVNRLRKRHVKSCLHLNDNGGEPQTYIDLISSGQVDHDTLWLITLKKPMTLMLGGFFCPTSKGVNELNEILT